MEYINLMPFVLGLLFFCSCITNTDDLILSMYHRYHSFNSILHKKYSRLLLLYFEMSVCFVAMGM